MECQKTDSKKVFKVFDASKRKKCRRKKEGFDDTQSLGTEESKSLIQVDANNCIKSAKASLQDVTGGHEEPAQWNQTSKRESSPSGTQSPARTICHGHRSSPRRHSRLHRDEISLALHAGLVSTPRSSSPQHDRDGLPDNIPIEQDSFIYAFLEEAIKKDKRRHRRRRSENHRASRDHDHNHNQACSRDHERFRDRVEHSRDRVERSRDRVERSRLDECHSPERIAQDRGREHRDYSQLDHRDFDDTSTIRDQHRHRRRRRREEPSRDPEHERPVKDKCPVAVIDQTVLLETFAKLCTTITEKKTLPPPSPAMDLVRNQSHKSLQCEVASKNEACEVDQRPVRLRSRELSPDPGHRSYTRVRSMEDVHGAKSRQRSPSLLNEDKYNSHYEKPRKYTSKMDMTPSRTRPMDEDRYRGYPPSMLVRSSMVHVSERDRRDFDERRDTARDRRGFDDDRRRYYEEDRRRNCEHKMSASFDAPRDVYADEERTRRTTRSDSRKKRNDDSRSRYDIRDRRFDDRRDKYYEEREKDYRDRHPGNIASKDCRWRRVVDRCERASLASRDEDIVRERDGCSERERDSGLSIADGETSTVSGKSNYLRVVKQGIAEQREAMDKMMKLWKELMRCFKSISQSPTPDKAAQDSAASVQESAAAQLRLWRECMRRYETVARDVGDTDARLMEELSKQRSEMAEMANMWQECLQRYRDISNDFNTLKQQLATDGPAQSQPTVRTGVPPRCAEGEGLPPVGPYRLPPAYPPPMPPAMGGYGGAGSSLRARASVPPAWWWGGDLAQSAARRRSSPDSRRSTSRDRERRHRHKDRERDDTRYKEKSTTKASGGARADHRHRKR